MGCFRFPASHLSMTALGNPVVPDECGSIAILSGSTTYSWFSMHFTCDRSRSREEILGVSISNGHSPTTIVGLSSEHRKVNRLLV